MELFYLPRYDGMHRRASVAYHEYKFCVREELEDVRAHLQGEWILIAQPRCGLGVSRYYFQAERCYRAVYHLKKNSTPLIFQAPKVSLRSSPCSCCKTHFPSFVRVNFNFNYSWEMRVWRSYCQPLTSALRLAQPAYDLHREQTL